MKIILKYDIGGGSYRHTLLDLAKVDAIDITHHPDNGKKGVYIIFSGGHTKNFTVDELEATRLEMEWVPPTQTEFHKKLEEAALKEIAGAIDKMMSSKQEEKE